MPGWLQPSGTLEQVSDPPIAARWMAAFMVVGGLYSTVLSLAVPNFGGGGPTLAFSIALGVVLVAGGCALWVVAPRTPRLLLALGGPVGVLIVGAANLGSGDSSVGSQLFFFYPVIYAASFLGARLTAVSVAMAVAAEAIIMGALETPATAITSTAGVGLTLALTAATILASRRRVDRAHARLNALAVEDPLTGLPNRRSFDDDMERSVAFARRTGAPLSLVLVDVDRFKTVNDSRGHSEGDRVLQAVAEALRSSVRRVDLAARIGGDEFALVLSACPADEAEHIARTASARVLANTQSQGHAVSVSCGVATMPDAASDVTGLRVAADRALYRAKESGRNRIDIASPAGITHDGAATPADTQPRPPGGTKDRGSVTGEVVTDPPQ